MATRLIRVSAILLACALAVSVADTLIAGQTGAANDSYQRSAEIFEMKTAAAHGAQRGEEIYYVKCWFCHNQHAKTGPPLAGLFLRRTLASGTPVNDATVIEKIRSGGRAMPAYRHVLADADLADLLSYLKDTTCCFEGTEPPPNPHYRAAPAPTMARTPVRRSLQGGARGLVRQVNGDPLEGIMVQLIAPATAIRTTVFTNAEGRYEFPLLDPGTYSLRIARPLDFKPYVREAVRIDGTTRLDDIVLERVTDKEVLPPTREILAQLTGADWMLNLPGTGEEKRTFSLTCGFGCHSYQQIFRTRYDEAGWRLIVRRMLRGAGSPLINIREPGPQTRGRAGRHLPEEEEIVIKWLARVRGPESVDAPLHHLPPVRGVSTRVVVTEYELPRQLLAPHDVHGDSQGIIWYTPHRSPYIGKLDPRTGVVKEYRVPDTPGALPGTHRVWVDKNDIVWLSENWAHNLTRFDPKRSSSSSSTSIPAIRSTRPVSATSTWTPRATSTRRSTVASCGSTAAAARSCSASHSNGSSAPTTTSSAWMGGTGRAARPAPACWGCLMSRRAACGSSIRARQSPARRAAGSISRGMHGSAGGAGCSSSSIRGRGASPRYYPPIPYVTFYEAMPDKNGEVWAGALHAGRFVRFNPRTERWVEYMMPEPYSHNRRTWIDNSTSPVTVWYVDHNGYMVRIQPLE